MSVEENKELIRRFYDGFYNEKNFALIDELFYSGYVHHAPDVRGGCRDYHEFREHELNMANAFPHQKVVIEDQVAEGDKVTTRSLMSGTQEADLPNIPSRGRHVEIMKIAIHRIENGKIREGWECYDLLGMMQQLGVAQITTTIRRGPQQKGYFPGGLDYNV